MARRPNACVSPLLFLGLIALAAPAHTASAGPVLIGGTSDGMLYDIDAATGVMSNPRDTGLDELSSLAFSPEGKLFAHTGFGRAEANTLFFIDVGSGVPHRIAHTGLWLADFAYDPLAQALVALAGRAGTGGGTLSHIDTQSGIATPGARVSPHAPLASNRFGAAFSLHPLDSSTSELGRLDLATGAVLEAWIIPVSIEFPGIVFTEDDRLFISDTGNDGATWLRVFDLNTETLATVGPLGADVVALAYLPEPSTIALLCSAGAIFPLTKNWRGRRRQTH